MPQDLAVSAAPTRRAALAGVLGASAAAWQPKRVFGQSLRKVRFAIPWVPEGSNLQAYVARNRGYWRRLGLDVEMSTGTGSNNAAQAIATGQFDIGFINASTLPVMAARDLKLIAIGQCDYKTTMGIGVLDGSPIRRPKDLEGRKLGGAPTSSEFPYLPAYAAAAGVDMTKVELVQLDARVRETALLQRQVDAITGVGSTMLSQLVPRGEKLRVMLYADTGLDQLLGQTMVATPEVIARDPGLVQAVVQGMMEATKFAALNFDESIEIFLREVPEMALNPRAKEQVTLSLGITQTMNLVPEVKAQGVGWMQADKYLRMWDLTQQFVTRTNTPRPPIETLMTNRFVGGVTYSDAEWTAIDARLAPFKAYFSV
ncbi:ABC transporter substrate-binding protein [Humitalea sp. 24SJ18S-53]|uniref:ABC transporter substrate-binding protein n=1 Tax=Humitalea sp. 24SJ18S-53 TaxID=3422307 RepID=UPI003D67500E